MIVRIWPGLDPIELVADIGGDKLSVEFYFITGVSQGPQLFLY